MLCKSIYAGDNPKLTDLTMKKQIIRHLQYALYIPAAFLGLSSCSSEGTGPTNNDNTEPTGSTHQALYTWVPSDCVAGTSCANQGIPDAIRRASIKYNIPRWFYFAEARRESSFNAEYWTGPDKCGTDQSTGFGLMQLTNPDHAGVPYPWARPAPDQSYTYWQGDMKITDKNFCSSFCPWINMNDVTPLTNCDAWKDPFANLDRFSSSHAAPMYNLFKKQQPGADPDVLLRQVAFYWRYGIFGPYYYPDDHYNYLYGASGGYDYDTYVGQYKQSVINDDGAWNGIVCSPPYSSQGCGSGNPPNPGGSLPTYSSSASASPSCLVAGAGTTAIKGTFTNTNNTSYNAMLDMEVWDGTTQVAQSYQAQSTTANGTTSLTWNWPVPTSVAQPKKDYTIKLGVFSADWATNPYFNQTAGTISVSADKSQYNFECGSIQNWQFVQGHTVAGISASANQAQSGAGALAIQFSAAAAGTTDVFTSVNPLPTVAGTLVTFHLWVPSGSAISMIYPYIKQGANGAWTWTNTQYAISALTANAWNTLTVRVPTNAVFPLDSMGLEFNTTGAYSGTAYIDAVTW
jgi:hypothetical protein